MRGAVQDVVKGLLLPGALVSQQVEVGRESVPVRLVSIRAIPDEKIQEAERAIERRSGRKVVLSIASIASQSELAQLMQSISMSEQPAQKASVASLEDIHSELMARITPILNNVWPAEAPLQSFDVAFSATGIVLNVRYENAHELGKISQDIIARDLREKLGTQDISLEARRASPPRNAGRKAKKELR